MEPLFTIIIPVYNCELYVSASLDSLLAQSLGDWEAVCINDGSRDGSQAVLESYAARDARIRVLSQQNAGVSCARNAGLDIAHGRYVLFLDADDTLLPESLALLAQEQLAAPDSLLMFGVAFCEECGAVEDKGPYSGYRTGEALRFSMTREWIFRLQPYSCNKLFDRARIESRGLRFPPGVPLNEDLCFLLNYAYELDSCVALPEPLYRYYQRESSVCGQGAKFDRPAQHYLNHVTLYIPLLDKLQSLPLLRRRQWQMGLYQKVHAQMRALCAWMRAEGNARPELQEELLRALAEFKVMVPFSVRVELLLNARAPRLMRRLYRALGVG